MTKVKMMVLGFLLTLSSSFAHAIVHAPTAAEAGAQPRGVAALRVFEKEGGHDCSATFVNDRLLITAKHCLDDAVNIVVTSIDGVALEKFVSVNTDRCIASKDFDLGLIRLPRATAKVWTSVSNTVPAVGSTVDMRGYGQFTLEPLPSPPFGQELEHVATAAIFKNENELITLRLHQTRAYPMYGDSGGPLLNSSGELVGTIINIQQVDDMDEFGNLWMQSESVSLTSPAVKKFIEAADAELP